MSPILNAAKMATLALLIGLIAAHWLEPLDAATVGLAALYALLILAG